MNERNLEEVRRTFVAMVADGAPVKTAARIVGIAASTGYAWARKRQAELGRHAPGMPAFARLVPRAELSGIELEVAGVVVKVRGEFDQATLARVVATLKEAT